MGIGLQIKQLLDEEKAVESRALGRFGKILRTSEDGYLITFQVRNSKQQGITTFEYGDKVEIVEKDGKYIVRNTFEEVPE
jgi:hypothetical protein